jgi:hypothetical protein
MTEREQVEAHWRRAALEFGISATIPYVMETPSGNVECTAYLPDFGGPNGMVVFARFEVLTTAEPKQFWKIAEARGLYASHMRVSPEYNRDQFVDALNDWGYFGNTDRAPLIR